MSDAAKKYARKIASAQRRFVRGALPPDPELVTVMFGGHYICDGFPSWEAGEAFADEIAEVLHLATWVCADSKAAHEHEVFPWVQLPIICHVSRPSDWADDPEVEELRGDWVERIAAKHGGKFCGT